jgi:molybdopterin-binding protein
MNRLSGTITQVQSDGALSLIDLQVGQSTLTALLVETPQGTPWLQANTPVELLFKELEVAIASATLSGEISLRNRSLSPIVSIRSDTLLSEVVFDFEGQTVRSIITTRSLKRLNLAVNQSAYWLVKANEIALKAIQA